MTMPTLHWHSGVIECDGLSARLGYVRRRFLVTLARAPNKDHSYDRLIQILWPDPEHEPSDARNCVHAHIVKMNRKLLPFGIVVQSDAGWGVRMEGALHIDWRRDLSRYPRGHHKQERHFYSSYLPEIPYEELRA